jgi:Leucine-rich repeat (LRR) protein
MDFAALDDDWKASIRNSLELGDTATPTAAQLKKAKFIEVRGRKIKDLAPLAAMPNLDHVNIIDTQVSDLGPLKGRTKLKNLWIRASKKVTDLTPIEGLKLEWLQLHNTGVGQKIAKAYGERHPDCTVDTGR